MIPPQEFLDREEVRRVSKIEILDEVEEWELIMVRNPAHSLPYLDVIVYFVALQCFTLWSTLVVIASVSKSVSLYFHVAGFVG